MGSGTRDIFGQAARPEPALPGTYGEPPRGHRLPDTTRLGAVRLQVADLQRSMAYYVEILGLRIVAQADGAATLAAHGDDRPLVELVGYPQARRAGRAVRTGLYHFAILLPDRASLGRFVRHLADVGVRAGAGDHLVSEAFYLHDPDGLGIEVYADRPRSEWRRIGRELMMATDPVDVPDLVKAAGGESWTGMPAGTVMGHVHLHVGDVGRAAAFYAEGLGFDRITWSYPGALFLSAGGYHHHVGTNTWAGPDAAAPARDEAQLLEWTLELPDAAAVTATAASVAAAGFTIAEDAPGEFVARDPWGTTVRVRTATAP